MSGAEKAATAGNLTAMLEDYDESILKDLPDLDDERRLSSLIDFNAGMCAAIFVIGQRLNRGEPWPALIARLMKEGEQIHERLIPDLYRKKT